MYKRIYYQALIERLKEPRKFIQVVYGPRQVGKTTLIQQIIHDIEIPYHYISADTAGESNIGWIEQQWNVARMRKKSINAGDFLLIFDEVQKIREWSEMVKCQWDKDTIQGNSIKLIISGSSKLLLQIGLGDSMAGRFETINMQHWTYKEIKEAFGLTGDQYVWFGGYPGAMSLIHDEIRWKDYIKSSLIDTTIHKDVLMLTRIDKPALLKRVMELSCYYSGQILAFNKMLGQLLDAGNTTTLSHYLDLLNEAGLVTGIQKYSREKVSEKKSSPKLMVQNTALMSGIKHELFKTIIEKPEVWGRHVESAVGAHLLNHSKAGNYDVYYWRERNDEIDFVLEKQEKVIGLEVKTGAIRKYSGISSFQEIFKNAKTFIVGSGGIPWEEFLLIKPNELFI
ncbi:MAG: ATP-binding protein [Bacteroidia bacterium]|nr:ATP-binding protein [Bacteroidia bacterium]